MKTIFGVWFVKSSEMGFIVRTVLQLLEETEMVSKASTWNTYLVQIKIVKLGKASKFSMHKDKNKVHRRPNICYIFEVQGYQI